MLSSTSGERSESGAPNSSMVKLDERFPKRRKDEFFSKLESKLLDLMRQGHIYLNHAPKFEKYGLCQMIRMTTLELDGLIVEAWKKSDNRTAIMKMDVKHEQIRHLWNLFYELRYFDYTKNEQMDDEITALRRFATINRIIDEIGKMIGGLKNGLKQSTAPQQ